MNAAALGTYPLAFLKRELAFDAAAPAARLATGEKAIYLPDLFVFLACDVLKDLHEGVEAEAEVRRLRASMNADVKPWITLDQTGGVDGAEAVYAGEENTVQANIDQTYDGTYTAAQASAAYDEPLTMNDVNAIAGLFIVS